MFDEKLDTITTKESPVRKNKDNYIYYDDIEKENNKDFIDVMLDDYMRIVNESSFTDALLFWKKYEVIFPI